MDIRELLVLLNSVSASSFYLVEYSSTNNLVQGEGCLIDLTSRQIFLGQYARNLSYSVTEPIRDSLAKWINKVNHESGDWLLISLSRDWASSKLHNSLRMISTSVNNAFVIIIDACPLYYGKERPFNLEYSSRSNQYRFTSGTETLMFSRPLLSPEEERCLFECSRGCSIQKSAELMCCSQSKVKWLRNSIKEKFNANNLFEVLSIIRLITFNKIFGR